MTWIKENKDKVIRNDNETDVQLASRIIDIPSNTVNGYVNKDPNKYKGIEYIKSVCIFELLNKTSSLVISNMVAERGSRTHY